MIPGLSAMKRLSRSSITAPSTPSEYHITRTSPAQARRRDRQRQRGRQRRQLVSSLASSPVSAGSVPGRRSAQPASGPLSAACPRWSSRPGPACGLRPSPFRPARTRPHRSRDRQRSCGRRARRAIARPAKRRRKRVEVAGVAEAEQPAAAAAGAAQLAAGARAGLDRLERAVGEEGREPVARAGEGGGAVDGAFVEGGAGEPGVGEVGLRRRCRRRRRRRGRGTAGPAGSRRCRPRTTGGRAGLDQLARVVDPDLRLRLGADPGVDEGLLVAPLAPAVAGGGAEREAAGLVVVERGEAVLALAEAPLLGAGAFPDRAPGQVGGIARPWSRSASARSGRQWKRAPKPPRPQSRRATAESSDDQPSRSECS